LSAEDAAHQAFGWRSASSAAIQLGKEPGFSR